MAWITKKTLFIALISGVISILLSGACKTAESAQEPAQIPILKLASIESITTAGIGNSTELVVKLSAPATYTSYKTTSPLRLVIDLSQVSPGDVNSPIAINRANFKTVTINRYDTDAGVLTRLEIELANDVEAVLNASPEKPGELRISFPTYSIISSEVTSKDQLNAADPKSLNPNTVQTGARKEPTAISSVASATPITTGSTGSISTKAAASSQAQPRKLSSIKVRDNSILLVVDGGDIEFKSVQT